MHLLSAILVIASVGANAAAVVDDGVETHRVLRAATKKADFYRRGVRISKRFETEMAYVDNENVWTDASTFASQVKVGSQKPVFNLEEHEHHLQGVECSGDVMKLHFVDASSARDARAACHSSDGGLIITSHSGCNEEGERSVYRVNDVSFAEDGKALDLSVAKTTWQEAFDHVNVTFGHTTDDHIYRRHADFASIRRRKRQGRVEIPADTPDDVNTAEFDLASEITNTTFGAVNFLDVIGDVVPVPGLPINVPIELGCTKCTTKGQLALSQGAFNIDASQIDLIPDVFQGGDDGKEISSVITGGFMELVATGVGARLELFARPTSTGAYEVALFSVPIVGFTIPGIGKAGAIFEPRVAFDFKVSGGVEVHYGLDINVPDGSSLRVELTDLSSSSLTGFQDTSFTPLPVTIDKTDIEVLLGLAFKPTVPIGFEFFDKLKAEVTASLDLPRLDAKLTTATPENCGGASNVTTPGPPFSNTTTDLSSDPITLGPLALVEANVSISCDVGFDVGLPLLPSPFDSVSVSQNVFKAVFPLISECTSPEGAFDNSSGLVIPPPMGNETTSAMPIMNATATPALNTTSSGTPVVDTTATPISNATSSTLVADMSPTLGFNTTSSGNLIADATATSTGQIASMNVTATQDGYVTSSTAMLNATASITSEIVSETSVSNTTAILTSADISATSTCDEATISTSEALSSTSTCDETTISTSKALASTLSLNSTLVSASSTVFTSSTLNPTMTLASSTVLTSSTLVPDTTLASSTPLATSSLDTTSTAVLNYTMSMTLTTEPTETSCESRSTTTLTNVSYVTSRITRETTVTPPASTTSLDSTVLFTLLSTSNEEAATETSAIETLSSASESLVQESSSSIEEATSTPQISATSTPKNTSASFSSTPESSSLSSPSTPEASTSIEQSSTQPSSSSAANSSMTVSSPIVSTSSVIVSAPAVSTAPAAPAPLAPTEPLPPPASVVTMGVGFLVPSNASALPVQQSGLTEFTGAAARDMQVRGQKVLLSIVMGFVGVWLL